MSLMQKKLLCLDYQQVSNISFSGAVVALPLQVVPQGIESVNGSVTLQLLTQLLPTGHLS